MRSYTVPRLFFTHSYKNTLFFANLSTMVKKDYSDCGIYNSFFKNTVHFAVAYPGIFFGGGSTNSVEDRGQRGRGSGGGRHLVRHSGGSCNLVQEISFHIVKFS